MVSSTMLPSRSIRLLFSRCLFVIHIWAALFIFMSASFYKWTLVENILLFSLVTQGAGAAVNLLLKYMLIPSHGALGAAYTTIISYFFVEFFSLLFYRRTRKVFIMMAKPLFLRFILRYTFKEEHEMPYKENYTDLFR